MSCAPGGKQKGRRVGLPFVNSMQKRVIEQDRPGTISCPHPGSSLGYRTLGRTSNPAAGFARTLRNGRRAYSLCYRSLELG